MFRQLPFEEAWPRFRSWWGLTEEIEFEVDDYFPARNASRESRCKNKNTKSGRDMRAGTHQTAAIYLSFFSIKSSLNQLTLCSWGYHTGPNQQSIIMKNALWIGDRLKLAVVGWIGWIGWIGWETLSICLSFAGFNGGRISGYLSKYFSRSREIFLDGGRMGDGRVREGRMRLDAAWGRTQTPEDGTAVGHGGTRSQHLLFNYHHRRRIIVSSCLVILFLLCDNGRGNNQKSRHAKFMTLFFSEMKWILRRNCDQSASEYRTLNK